MITNERQYRITQAKAKRLEEALADDRGPEDVDPHIYNAMRAGIESHLKELREEVAQYDALRKGHVRQLKYDSLAELPKALIAARIAANLTQKELAQRLGLKEQQIQRYEATHYASASLERLMEVAEALGITIHYDVLLPSS